jgi:hypothetical protein
MTAHGLQPTVKGNTLTVPTFACMRCHKPSQQAGRGYRMLLGARVQVCAACKVAIDARRAKGAR